MSNLLFTPVFEALLKILWHCIILTSLLDSRMKTLNSGKNRTKINSPHTIFTPVHQVLKFGWYIVYYNSSPKKWLEKSSSRHHSPHEVLIVLNNTQIRVTRFFCQRIIKICYWIGSHILPLRNVNSTSNISI